MDDLDDLIDDVFDSPKKKGSKKSDEKKIRSFNVGAVKKKKDSFDDLDDVLDDVLGKESKNTKQKKESYSYKTKVKDEGFDDFGGYEEERKTSEDVGWGDSSGGSGGSAIKSAGYAPKKPKKGDK